MVAWGLPTRRVVTLAQTGLSGLDRSNTARWPRERQGSLGPTSPETRYPPSKIIVKQFLGAVKNTRQRAGRSPHAAAAWDPGWCQDARGAAVGATRADLASPPQRVLGLPRRVAPGASSIVPSLSTSWVTRFEPGGALAWRLDRPKYGIDGGAGGVRGPQPVGYQA